MNKRNLSIAVVLILFLTLTGLSCQKEEPEPSPTSTETAPTVDANLSAVNLTNVDSATIDTIIQQNYNLAKVKSQEWKPDANLYTITVKLPADLAVNSADETFIFGSASDPNNWWSFSVAEQTSRYIRAIIPKEDYLGTDVQPINITYWKMNYSQAFQLAETNGGQTFRATNQNATITATLHHTQPRGWLWWEIEYKSSANRLVIKINPNNGDIIDESGNPLASGDLTSPAPDTTPTPLATTPSPYSNY